MAQEKNGGAGQVIALVVVAVILGIGYVALDYYSDGEKNKAIAESRGMQVVQALSRHRLETQSYPSTLAALAPKFVDTLPKCPAGDAFDFKLAGNDYTLTCNNIVFKSKPYTYDSRTRVWQG
ncbi:MAG: hypothetical protein ACKVQK_28235 [Burkholderiales bacterium]